MLLFFLNATATTQIYPLSLHDALPIFMPFGRVHDSVTLPTGSGSARTTSTPSAIAATRLSSSASRSRKADRKSTRLNSSHLGISYAVFCLKKKKEFSSRASPADKPPRD